MKTILWLHASKDSNYERGEELGLSEEAIALFRHACTEVKVEVEVEEETGVAEIIAVNDHTLDGKSEIAELRGVLKTALGMINHVTCPECGGRGAVQLSEDEIHQCRWCYETEFITKTLNEKG